MFSWAGKMSNLKVCYEIFQVGYSNQKAEETNLDVLLNHKSKEAGVGSKQQNFTTCKWVLIFLFAIWGEDRPASDFQNVPLVLC